MQIQVPPRNIDPRLNYTISEGFRFRDIFFIARDLVWGVPVLILIAVGISLFLIPVALYGMAERVFKFRRVRGGIHEG